MKEWRLVVVSNTPNSDGGHVKFLDAATRNEVRALRRNVSAQASTWVERAVPTPTGISWVRDAKESAVAR